MFTAYNIYDLANERQRENDREIVRNGGKVNDRERDVGETERET